MSVTAHHVISNPSVPRVPGVLLDEFQLFPSKGSTLRPVHPPVAVPRGMHLHVHAVHDRKPITQAQMEAAHQRRMESISANKDKRRSKVIVSADSKPNSRRKRAPGFDEKV